MNPLFQEFVGAVVRHGLTAVGMWLVTEGVITEDQSNRFIAGAVLFVVSVLWSLYQKYGNRLKILTALASPSNSTEIKVERMISEGQAPSVMLAKTEQPRLQTK